MWLRPVLRFQLSINLDRDVLAIVTALALLSRGLSLHLPDLFHGAFGSSLDLCSAPQEILRSPAPHPRGVISHLNQPVDDLPKVMVIVLPPPRAGLADKAALLLHKGQAFYPSLILVSRTNARSRVSRHAGCVSNAPRWIHVLSDSPASRTAPKSARSSARWGERRVAQDSRNGRQSSASIACANSSSSGRTNGGRSARYLRGSMAIDLSELITSAVALATSASE